MKNTLSQIVRVAENLYRDPRARNYYGIKKIAGRRRLKALKMGKANVTDRVTANGKLKDWLRDLDVGDASSRDLKLKALVENFIATRKGKAKSTQAGDRAFASVLKKGFIPGMGVAVREIRTSDLLKWLVREAKAREWKWRTYNAARYFLRQLFDLAVADRILSDAENPFIPRLIRPEKCAKVRRNIPTLEEFEAIVENVRTQRDNPDREESADFLAFLGLAGVGQAEAFTLTWDDVDLANKKINFVRMKTKRPFTVPIYEWLAPLIQKLREKPRHIDGKLFHMRDGKKALGRACKRLGFPHFTQRNLRAMCIRRLYDAGVPVKRIALWQGHNDGGILIQKIYTEIFRSSDSAAEAADLALVTSANAL